MSLGDLKNIPKKLYLYWDGYNKLSFLQYLTVKSFTELNMDWEIIVYLPEVNHKAITWSSNEQKTPYCGEDYFDKLKELNIRIEKINFDNIGFRNDVPEVIKSDYLRYYLLATFGGCWVDFDVLFIRPFNDIKINNYEVYGNREEIDTVIIFSGDYFPIGFLMSSQNNPVFKNLINNCKAHLNLNDYQTIGCKLFKSLFGTPMGVHNKHKDSNILFLPISSYLPFEWNSLHEIFLTKNYNKINDNTFGIHWFNGSNVAKLYQNSLDQNKMNKNGSISLYVEKYLNYL